MKLSEKELRKRDARRDIGAEVLQAVRQIKAGKGRRFAVKIPPIVAMRQKAKLSQTEFARTCSGFQFAPCRTGSKGAANPLELRARCC